MFMFAFAVCGFGILWTKNHCGGQCQGEFFQRVMGYGFRVSTFQVFNNFELIHSFVYSYPILTTLLTECFLGVNS